MTPASMSSSGAAARPSAPSPIAPAPERGLPLEAGPIQIERLGVTTGAVGPQEASLTLTVDGERRSVSATGEAPLEAVFNAIRRAAPHHAVVRQFDAHSFTEGANARAQASVRLEEDGRSVTGHSAAADTFTASARAYVSALNGLMARRASVPTPMELAGGFWRG